jgi:hypothetical protein
VVKIVGLMKNICLVIAVSFAVSACSSDRQAPAPVEYAGNSLRGYSVPVGRGDSYYTIAQRYNLDLRALLDANNARPPYNIFPGQKLVLPAPKEYLVRTGDTLYGISREFGATMSQENLIHKNLINAR